MQPVGIIVFASVMATLGLQVLLESARILVSKKGSHMNSTEEKWMIGIMASATVVKFLLMLYCRSFKNEIVRAYAQDHLFDVITNSVGLATAVLAVKFYWWIDPSGAILIALYTISIWARTVLENVHSLIGKNKKIKLNAPKTSQIEELLLERKTKTVMNLRLSQILNLLCFGLCLLQEMKEQVQIQVSMADVTIVRLGELSQLSRLISRLKCQKNKKPKGQIFTPRVSELNREDRHGRYNPRRHTRSMLMENKHPT